MVGEVELAFPNWSRPLSRKQGAIGPIDPVCRFAPAPDGQFIDTHSSAPFLAAARKARSRTAPAREIRLFVRLNYRVTGADYAGN